MSDRISEGEDIVMEEEIDEVYLEDIPPAHVFLAAWTSREHLPAAPPSSPVMMDFEEILDDYEAEHEHIIPSPEEENPGPSGSFPELETEDNLQYKFFPVQTQALKFHVKAPSNAHIAFTAGPAEANPMYEIFIGGWENTKTAIRKNREKPDVAEVPTKDIVTGAEFRTFWVTFYNKTIALGLNEDTNPIIQWPDPELFPITHFGVRTAWGAKGSWKIEDTWNGWQSGNPGIGWAVGVPTGGNGTWVGATGGQIPPNAMIAGFDNEDLYIGRAVFQNSALIPGKILPSHGVCYIAWGGGEHAQPEYEVLCDCTGTWMRTSGGNIPPTAIPGGKTEDGETLYIGRTEHEGAVAVGKVQKSHGVCYIPFGGQEIAKEDYEILVVP